MRRTHTFVSPNLNHRRSQPQRGSPSMRLDRRHAAGRSAFVHRRPLGVFPVWEHAVCGGLRCFLVDEFRGQGEGVVCLICAGGGLFVFPRVAVDCPYEALQPAGESGAFGWGVAVVDGLGEYVEPVFRPCVQYQAGAVLEE